MKKSEWGPHVWAFLHLLTMRLKDEHFESYKAQVFDIIRGICANLPCPYCSQHANQFLRRYNVNQISNKTLFIKMIFLLHNNVNKRLKQPIFEFEKMNDTYKHYNFKAEAVRFYHILNQSVHAERMMMYNFHKKQFILKYKTFMKGNLDKFVHVIA